jgi:GH15 family glucan-1,4-alpha-glucosidase
MIHRDRLTANLEGGFVVFLIGMRVNRPLLIQKWWPVAVAMPRMLNEMWFSRTIILLQYWRSTEHLMAYAKSKEAAHLPAWQAFNKAVGTNGSVGIWHETYKIAPGGYENVYVNMPPFGLGRAGKLQEAKGDLKSASDRLRANVK